MPKKRLNRADPAIRQIFRLPKPHRRPYWYDQWEEAIRAEAKTRSGRTASLVETLGRAVIDGRYASGERLPVEGDIAATWNISRTVVREAVRSLAAKGLVSVGPKVGTCVLDPQNWNMLDGDVMRWHLTASEPRDFVISLYEMRLINEPAAAGQTAHRGDAQTTERLRDALNAMAENPRGSDALIAADLAFHRIILEATGNPILRSFGALVEKSLSISFSLSWRRNPQEETVRQHRRVFEAIAGGDVEAAQLFMRRLIESAFDDVMAELYAAEPRYGSPSRSGLDATPVHTPDAGLLARAPAASEGRA